MTECKSSLKGTEWKTEQMKKKKKKKGDGNRSGKRKTWEGVCGGGVVMGGCPAVDCTGPVFGFQHPSGHSFQVLTQAFHIVF